LTVDSVGIDTYSVKIAPHFAVSVSILFDNGDPATITATVDGKELCSITRSGMNMQVTCGSIPQTDSVKYVRITSSSAKVKCAADVPSGSQLTVKFEDSTEPDWQDCSDPTVTLSAHYL
jgi:hypothetical protein